MSEVFSFSPSGSANHQSRISLVVVFCLKFHEQEIPLHFIDLFDLFLDALSDSDKLFQ
jgi:hypothetical protein